MLAFPISSFYEFSTIDETKYTPGERTIVEIPKKFCFLPGPRTVWAVKTRDGYEVYAKFEQTIKKSKESTLNKKKPVSLAHDYILDKGIFRTMNPDFSDLNLITHLDFTKMAINRSGVESLDAIKIKKLEMLNAQHTKISDLTALIGMPLKTVDVSNTQVRDISPLTGSPIESLNIQGTLVKDITPILRMNSLNQLNIENCQIEDISPIATSNIKKIYIGHTYCTRSIKEGKIWLELKTTLDYIKKGIEALKNNQTIERINYMDPSKFWHEYDNGKYRGGFSELDKRYNASENLNDFIFINIGYAKRDSLTNKITHVDFFYSDIRQIPYKQYQMLRSPIKDDTEVVDYEKKPRRFKLKIKNRTDWVDVGSSKPLRNR